MTSPYQLNTCGLSCPEPIMLLRRHLSALAPGERLALLADDPTTHEDVPRFCRFIGHRLLKRQIQAIPYTYLIEKGD